MSPENHASEGTGAHKAAIERQGQFAAPECDRKDVTYRTIGVPVAIRLMALVLRGGPEAEDLGRRLEAVFPTHQRKHLLRLIP